MNRAGAVAFSLVFAVGVASPGGLAAQEEHGGHAADPEDHAAAVGEHDEEHHHKNHVALFVGSTQAELEHGEREDPQFTLGLDYERRLTPVVGVGAVLDLVLEGQREGILGLPVFLHAGSFTFQIAPGGERIRDGRDWSFVTRLGVLYDFEVGTMTLAPALFYDFTKEGGTWVVGINIGRGF